MQNARLSERAPFFAEVDILALGSTTPRRVWGTDVSDGGMFLQTTHPFRVGDRVSLRFGVQVDGDEEHEVHVRAAEVRWVRPFEPVAVDGHLPGVGLQFVSIDPPARAALRRFAQPAARDDITMPERPADGQASDDGLGMLPAPTASLPPVTASIVRTASMHQREITEEMLAVSLAPFSTPPRAPNGRTSLPPDEPMDDGTALNALAVFHTKPPHAVPRNVTMMPRSQPPRGAARAGTEPPHHALVGWTFKRVVFEDEVTERSVPSQPPRTTQDANTLSPSPAPQHNTAPRAAADDSLAPSTLPPGPAQSRSTAPLAEAYESLAPSTLPPGPARASHGPTSARSTAPPALNVDITAPPEPTARLSAAPRLGLSFDDDAPAGFSARMPSIIVEPSVLSLESMRDSTAPHASSSGPNPAIEEAFMRGEASLLDLPTLDERPAASRAPKQRAQRAAPAHRRGMRALPVAAVLIVLGTVVGAGLGLAGKRLARATPALAQRSAPTPAAAVLPPARAPEALAALPPPDARPVAAVAEVASVADVADVERGVPARAMPEERTPAWVAALAPRGASAASKAAPPGSALFVSKADAKSDAAPSKTARSAPAASAAAGFKLDIPVGEAHVTRSFVLSSPSRVVVDLDGGTLPKDALDGDGKRTRRVRFGTPSPGTSRVVVELADGVTASDVKARVSDGRLALSFR